MILRTIKHHHIFLSFSLTTKIFVRFYPGADRLSLIRNTMEVVKPFNFPKNAIMPYNPIIAEIYLKNRYDHNPLLKVQLDVFRRINHITSTPKSIAIDKSLKVISPNMQKVLDYISKVQPDPNNINDVITFISNNLTNNKILPKFYLEILLDHLNSNIIDKELTENLTNKLKHYFENKTKVISQPIDVIPQNENDYQKRIREFLSISVPSRSFTYQDYLMQRDYYKEGLSLLEKYSNDMSVNQILEIAQRAKILTYADVFYKETEFDIFSKYFEIIQIHRASEGAKMLYKVYDILNNYNKHKTPEEREKFFKEKFPTIHRYSLPTQQQLNKIKEDLENKKFSIGILNREFSETNNLNPLILTGHDLHFLLVTRDASDPQYGFILGMFTSNKDKGTVKLANTQEINLDPNEKNKEQRWRSAIKLFRININNFIEDEKATLFAKSYNLQGEDVHDIIKNAINQNWKSLKENVIEDPIVFTKEIIRDISLISFEMLIEEYNLWLNNFNKLNEDAQQKKMDQAISQKKKYLKEEKEQKYVASLSSEEKILYKIEQLLEKRIRGMTNNDDENQSLININDDDKVEIKSDNEILDK